VAIGGDNCAGVATVDVIQESDLDPLAAQTSPASNYSCVGTVYFFRYNASSLLGFFGGVEYYINAISTCTGGAVIVACGALNGLFPGSPPGAMDASYAENQICSNTTVLTTQTGVGASKDIAFLSAINNYGDLMSAGPYVFQ
jgi:hypothetical protein